MRKPFTERVISQFTVFEALYRTDQGLDLSQRPFSKHEKVLRDRADYGPCQALGTVLREREIQAITYLSARTVDDRLNVALFSPLALRSRKHRNPEHGICETLSTGVSFRLGKDLITFPSKAGDSRSRGRRSRLREALWWSGCPHNRRMAGCRCRCLASRGHFVCDRED